MGLPFEVNSVFGGFDNIRVLHDFLPNRTVPKEKQIRQHLTNAGGFVWILNCEDGGNQATVLSNHNDFRTGRSLGKTTIASKYAPAQILCQRYAKTVAERQEWIGYF